MVQMTGSRTVIGMRPMAVRLLLVAMMAAFTFGAFALYVNSTEAGPVVGFTVDDTGDLPDFNPGDGICDTSVAGPPVDCTFRAALEESNALNGPNEFDFTVSTTAPLTPLPVISERVTIDASGNPAASTSTPWGLVATG